MGLLLPATSPIGGAGSGRTFLGAGCASGRRKIWCSGSPAEMSPGGGSLTSIGPKKSAPPGASACTRWRTAVCAASAEKYTSTLRQKMISYSPGGASSRLCSANRAV